MNNWENLKLLLFGGKGGVGKSTTASSSAIYLAGKKPDKRILIISTDPAHSLGDSLDCRIGENITLVPGMNNLWGQELNAPKLVDEFKLKYGEVIKTLT